MEPELVHTGDVIICCDPVACAEDPPVPITVQELGKLDAESARSSVRVSTGAIEDDGLEELWHLGIARWEKFQKSGPRRAKEDLEEAITCGVVTLEALNIGARYSDPELTVASAHYHLARYLQTKFKHYGDIEDLSAAIEHMKSCINTAEPEEKFHAFHLSYTGELLMRRSRERGQREDLEDGIKYIQLALVDDRYTAGNELDIEQILNVMIVAGTCFLYKFDWIGNLGDLEKAIELLEAASTKSVDARYPDHKTDRIAILGTLGFCYMELNSRTGSFEALESAVRCNEVAAHVQLQTGTGNSGSVQLDLDPELTLPFGAGLTHLQRYRATGNLHELEAAISNIQASVERMHARSDIDQSTHPDVAARLCQLGSCFIIRGGRTGNSQDLEVGIKHIEAAIEIIPARHEKRSSMLMNLGGAYNEKWQQTNDIKDADAIIKYMKESIDLAQQDDKLLPHRLSTLGTGFSNRFRSTHDIQDLNMAIASLKRSIELSPHDHPATPHTLNNLGIFLIDRSRLNGDFEELWTGLLQLNASINMLPQDHPAVSGYLYNCGIAMLGLTSTTQESENIKLALIIFKRGFENTTSNPVIRLRCALAAAELLVYNPASSDIEQAYPLLSRAVELMPLANARNLGRDDQQHRLKVLSGLSCLAAAVTLALKHTPTEAIRLLEIGRNITNGQLLDYRTDLACLKDSHPDLGAKFDSLRLELDGAWPVPQSSSSNSHFADPIGTHLISASRITRLTHAAQELDAILPKIREKPRFEEFLLPPSSQAIMAAAQKGPIVVLNVTKLCSHAIIVTPDNISSISLPALCYKEAWNQFGPASTYADLNRSATGGRGGGPDPGIRSRNTRKLLGWLWESAVEPVLVHLGLFPKPRADESAARGRTTYTDDLPRIWWIGTGPLAQAPIHAAGKYTRGSQKFTLNYCIPIFTPSLRALMHSRAQLEHDTRRNFSSLDTLVVAMPATPGYGDLHGIQEEAQGILNIGFDQAVDLEGLIAMGRRCRVDTLIKPTAEEVLGHLDNYGIVHLACHGIATLNPADSHLALVRVSISSNGHYTEEIDRLGVRDIARKRPKSGRLAFLSACSTATNRNQNLLDEGTNIASAFHIAGFSHVVGTLWPAEDEACTMMAKEFYRKLHATNDVAGAYHFALLKLRGRGLDHVLFWAPFILMGA